MNNYLPLSGGQLTSADLSRNVTTSHLQLRGGTTILNGAYLSLGGKDFDARPGAFYMVARNAETGHALTGSPDGSLTWGGKNIDVIESQGDGWIRYSNGLQICWFTANNTNSGWQGYSNVSYPIPFANDDVFITFCNRTDVNSSTNMHEIRIAAKVSTHFWAYWLVDGVLTSEQIGGDFIAIGRWK